MAESRHSSIQLYTVDNDIISPYLQGFESVPPLVHSGRTHECQLFKKKTSNSNINQVNILPFLFLFWLLMHEESLQSLPLH